MNKSDKRKPKAEEDNLQSNAEGSRNKGPIKKVNPKGKIKGAPKETLVTTDTHQDPDYTVSGMVDGNGLVLTNVEVYIVFWGNYWNGSPSPTWQQYVQAFTGIVTGPYLTGLRQYRGVGPGTMIGNMIYTDAEPVNGYSDGDLEDMLKTLFQNHPEVPPPTAGHFRFYAVVTPPGINNGLVAYGEHQHWDYNGVTAYSCWINSQGGLTEGSSFGVINTFSYELAETVTDPNNDGFHVTKSGGGSGDEIGDTCNNEFAIIQMNGLTCNVQCYWSEADNSCIIPLGSLSFVVNKNYFSKDEVLDAIATNNGVFSNAFYLDLEDFSINTFNSFQVTIPTPSGAFTGLTGVTITPTPQTPGGAIPAQPIPIYEVNDPTVIQRIRFSFDINFASPLSTPFPANEKPYDLTATFKTAGVTVPGVNSSQTINFYLLPGADPYFSNIDPNDNQAVPYLSQDLRVFTITKNQSALPGDINAQAFQAGQSPYDYIRYLIGYLNGSDTYTIPVPPGSSDPLNALVNQDGYETGESSVTPGTLANKNYNFAIARVRLRSNEQGALGEAKDTRVFFRLWIAPSYDTDFEPNTTYLSNPAYPALPKNPLPSSANLPNDPSGQAIRTTPFFATDSSGTNDYNNAVTNNNIQTIQIPTQPGRDSVWAYYGCFLDVYDSNNNCSYPGTHHCLVAQIAFDDAPIPYTAGSGMNPGNIDKLAQRNLQVTLSGNPGPASTHRIPQAFDTRPSLPFKDAGGKIITRPDELMIDWGNVPVGSDAYIYWPHVNASEVIKLASQLYYTNVLSVADSNTIHCKSVNGVTYIPIPSAAGKTFAGLFTVDLPIGVIAGQEYNILVRRLSSKIVTDKNRFEEESTYGRKTNLRYITGSFNVKIPVTTEANMLPYDENTLAILKWRLENMSPLYRWHPVLKKLITYMSGRIDGSGGNSHSIKPSQWGTLHLRPHGEYKIFTGKISEVIYNCFGEFEGFVLCTCCSDKHHFLSKEKEIGELALKACKERLNIAVYVEERNHNKICKLVVHC